MFHYDIKGMSDFRKEVVEIKPTNAGNGTFSFSGGSPLVEFQIPQQPRFLLGKTLRINGRITVKRTGGAAIDNATPASVCRLDSRTGISSILDMVSVGNNYGQTFELVKHYNRLCSSILPLNTGIHEYLNGGANISYGANAKKLQQGLQINEPQEFSMPLLVGILQGRPLDLNMSLGCKIQLNLAPDNFVLFDDSLEGGNNTAAGATYSLDNLSLTFDSLVPQGAGVAGMMSNTKGAWEYNSFSSFYNVIQSTDHTATFNLNLSRVQGIIMNLVPSSWLNTTTRNSNKATHILNKGTGTTLETVEKGIDELVFYKGGMRFPLDFELSEASSVKQNTPSATLLRTSLNGLNNVWSMDNFLQSPRTDSLNTDKFTTSTQLNDRSSVNTIGISYDHITDNGVDFKRDNWSFRIKSPVEAQTPMSAFIFVKHKNMIVFNNGQVNVQN